MGYRDAFVPPSPVPDDSYLFTGIDPAWSPKKENQGVADCEVCGGTLRRHADPIRHYETLVMVCGGCNRSRYEGVLPGSQHEPSDDRPGRMASKVVGPPTPECDAYLRHELEMKTSGIPDVSPPIPATKEPPDA